MWRTPVASLPGWMAGSAKNLARPPSNSGQQQHQNPQETSVPSAEALRDASSLPAPR
jgi:hypothetical protein